MRAQAAGWGTGAAFPPGHLVGPAVIHPQSSDFDGPTGRAYVFPVTGHRSPVTSDSATILAPKGFERPDIGVEPAALSGAQGF